MAKGATKRTQHAGTAKFPYAELPSAVRKLLAEIPKRPRPLKLNEATAASWGLGKGPKTRSAVSVLKKIGLISDSAEPLEPYVQYMTPGTGPKALANLIRQTYRPLFDASHSPQNETGEALQSLFNIHSGGTSIPKQIQTFKALCEYADFSGSSVSLQTSQGSAGGASSAGSGTLELPPIKIDLHIHLPENKTTRDYEAIIQDIARYIYGRKELGSERA